MGIFWRLVFGHLLADFTFQTDFINRWKRTSWTGLVVHCLMHPVFYAALCWPYMSETWLDAGWVRLNGWACLGLVFAAHLVEDWWRIRSIREYGMRDNTAFFIWDQLIHYAVIFVVAPMAIVDAGVSGLFPEKWPVLGCLFVLVTHACTVIVYFLENEVRRVPFPSVDEKYLSMIARLILALCFLFPSLGGACGLAAIWLAVMVFLRSTRLFDLTAFSFYGSVAVAVSGGLAARAVYYS